MGARIVVIGPDKPIYNERKAAAITRPGMLVEPTAADVVALADATTVNLTPEVAVENDIYGGGVDDNYAVGAIVLSQVLRSGCEFYGLLAAAGTNIAFGDPIGFGTGGHIAKVAEANAFGYARETVAADASVARRVRVQVR